MGPVKLNRQKETGRITFFLLWLFCTTFIVLGFITVEPNIFTREVSTERTQIYADRKEESEDGTWSYYLDVREYAKDGQYIQFYTNHQVVYVYSNNRICYSLQPTNSIWGHSTGSSWNTIKLPTSTSILRVEVKRVYEEMGNIELSFFVGEPDVMTRSVIMDSLAGVLTGFTIFICGLIMMVYWFSGGENKGSAMGTFYFAFFTIIMGVWSIGETQAAMIVIKNRLMASYLGYMCIYFLIVPFTMFVRYFLHSERDIWYKIYFGIWTLGLVTSNVLQVMNIRDMKQTAFVLHGIMALGLAYCLYLLIKGFISKKYRKECWQCTAGLACILVAYIVDVVWFYAMNSHSNQAGKFGFLVFILILGSQTVQNNEINMKQARLMSIYQEMAVKDILSGCFNRNAFDQEIEERNKMTDEEKMNLVVYTFDLNNLKVCNDSLGHGTGDQYIMDTAKLLSDTFGTNEKVYRIGGDEFSIIQDFVSYEKSEQLCKTICNNRFRYGGNDRVVCSVAAGYARYIRGDESLNNTRLRADSMMYANKKKMKEQKS